MSPLLLVLGYLIYQLGEYIFAFIGLLLVCLLFILGSFLITGCGNEYQPPGCYTQGNGCSSSATPEDTRTSTGPTGPAGQPGSQGVPGQRGEPGSSGEPGARGDTGPMGNPGSNGQDGSTGPQGVQGIPGPVGPAGTPGSSCSVIQLGNGARIVCTDGSEAVVINGTNGSDAPVSQYSVLEVIDPCGDTPGFDEVLLRLANNTLLAHYSDGQKQFLVLIGPGSYVTTDGKNCHFTVDTNMGVTW